MTTMAMMTLLTMITMMIMMTQKMESKNRESESGRRKKINGNMITGKMKVKILKQKSESGN